MSNSELRYDLVLSGRIIGSASPEVAMAGLAQVLRMSEEQVAVAFAKAPIVIKKDVEAEAAQRIQAALQKLSLEVMLQPIETSRAIATVQTVVGDSLNQAAVLTAEAGATDDNIGFRVQGNPDHGVLTLQIPPKGAIYGDSSAIVCLDSQIKMRRADENGGLGARYASYINLFCADELAGELCLAAKLPGEICSLTITSPLRLRVSCYLASSVSICFTTGETANTDCPAELNDRFLQCEGPGVIWLSACGGIVQTELKNPFVCRTDRILAWQGDVTFNSNDGELTEVSGSGTLWLQTLSEAALSNWARSLASN